LVGALAAVAITILLLGFNFLKGEEVFSTTTDYNVSYKDAMGLQNSSAVLYKGIKVGTVRKVQLREDKAGVIVQFYVNDKVKLTKGSSAKLVTTDLFNTRAIEISLAEGTEYLAKNDKLYGEIDPGLIDKLSVELSPLLNDIKLILINVDSITAAIDHNSLRNTLHNIEGTTASLDAMLNNKNSDFNRILNNVASISKNLKDNNELLTAAMANVHAITDSLAKADLTNTIAQARNALAETAILLQKINDSEGSMGLLVNDKVLYNNLAQTSENLDKLLVDMKANPKRYVHFSVFGKKEKHKE
jgi:phospholipid/cholesterol/gamma-HCH transport system substrate-binding protein